MQIFQCEIKSRPTTDPISHSSTWHFLGNRTIETMEVNMTMSKQELIKYAIRQAGGVGQCRCVP